MGSIFHGWRFRKATADKESPYLWMGSLRNVWLELPAATTHADLVNLAERLCREFGGVVIERYPERGENNHKEYWWMEIAGVKFLLMRKGSIALSAGRDPGEIELLIKIAKGMGVERFVGWRWVLWRILRHRNQAARPEKA